jgi:hypothetical protein
MQSRRVSISNISPSPSASQGNLRSLGTLPPLPTAARIIADRLGWGIDRLLGGRTRHTSIVDLVDRDCPRKNSHGAVGDYGDGTSEVRTATIVVISLLAGLVVAHGVVARRKFSSFDRNRHRVVNVGHRLDISRREHDDDAKHQATEKASERYPMPPWRDKHMVWP